MNDELQKKLVEYLGVAEKAASDAVIFGKAEIPQYIQELIRWEIAFHLIWVAAALVVAGAGIYALRIAKGLKQYGGKEELTILGVVLLLAAGVTTTIATMGAAKPYFAPRVLLVEKLSSMVRK